MSYLFNFSNINNDTGLIQNKSAIAVFITHANTTSKHQMTIFIDSPEWISTDVHIYLLNIYKLSHNFHFTHWVL